MNTGAESLVKTLLASDVNVCFANPGTSEMHFVAALDRIPGMRCVLGLFEGVVTGAADGYARMADKPAATLLHLGPGLANGIANLHNARKAHTSIVNIVGEHATEHLQHESPLRSDTKATASLCSDWVKVASDPARVAADAAEAVEQARRGAGKIATLILPANAAWGAGDEPRAAGSPPPLRKVDEAMLLAAGAALRSGKRCALMMTGVALREAGTRIAGRIAQATGARLLAQQSNARVECGRGRVPVERVPFAVDQAVAMLADIEVLILLGANPPAAFFKYPDRPSMQTAPACHTLVLAQADDDLMDALARLEDAVGARGGELALARQETPPLPVPGRLTADAVMQSLAAQLPDQAILCDESVSSGRTLLKFTANAAPHDYLQITGGAIGHGLPMATGAAIACPGRKVVCLEGDGSGMYTLQALWTQAREQLDVVTIILANRGYRILQRELKEVGIAEAGVQANRMLNLTTPALDWKALARGMGVEAASADDAGTFNDLLRSAIGRKGPFLIEAIID